MLELRLKYLYPLVDLFVCAESDETFSGDKRQVDPISEHPELKFAYDKLYRMATILSGNGAWERESSLRNSLATFFTSVDMPEYFGDAEMHTVMLSDVDEIPSENIIKRVKRRELSLPFACAQDFFYYTMTNRRKETWHGTIFTDTTDFVALGPQNLRNRRNALSAVGDGGWHFSYFGDPDYIRLKLSSFSHQEYNCEPYTSIKHIEDHIRSGADLFDRGTPVEKVSPAIFPTRLREIAEGLGWL